MLLKKKKKKTERNKRSDSTDLASLILLVRGYISMSLESQKEAILPSLPELNDNI